MRWHRHTLVWMREDLAKQLDHVKPVCVIGHALKHLALQSILR